MNFSIGLSGLNTATKALDKAAVEISRTGIESMPRSEAFNPAQANAAAALPDANASINLADPDLPNAIVSQIAASAAFMANVQSIRRADETTQALLNLK